MKMKVDNKFGSIWDELPNNNSKSEKNIPTSQSEAMDFYEAAQKSVNKSLMKTWDSHNDMVKKSAELRKISERKKIIERQNQERIEENKERFIEAAEKSAKIHKDFEKISKKN